VNLTVLPTSTPPDYKALCPGHHRFAGVKIVETAGTPEVRELWAMMKPHGITILHKCTAVRHALSAEKQRLRHHLDRRLRVRRAIPARTTSRGLILIPARPTR
jgi:hypothetical protein